MATPANENGIDAWARIRIEGVLGRMANGPSGNCWPSLYLCFQAVCFTDGQPGIVSRSSNILRGISEQHDLTLVGSQQWIARFRAHGEACLS